MGSKLQYFKDVFSSRRCLHDFQEAAAEWAKRKLPEGAGEIKMGFHALPSLLQLHLHVVSQVRNPLFPTVEAFIRRLYAKVSTETNCGSLVIVVALAVHCNDNLKTAGIMTLQRQNL